MSQVEDDVLNLFRSKLESDPNVPDVLIDDLMLKLTAEKLDTVAILGAIANSTRQGSV